MPFSTDSLVGLTVAEALEQIRQANLTWRVIERDGQKFMVSMEYNAHRVQLVIKDNLITGASIG